MQMPVAKLMYSKANLTLNQKENVFVRVPKLLANMNFYAELVGQFISISIIVEFTV